MLILSLIDMTGQRCDMECDQQDIFKQDISCQQDDSTPKRPGRNGLFGTGAGQEASAKADAVV